MATQPPARLRTATPADQSSIEQLIAVSVPALSAEHYTAAQIEGALRGAIGLDTQLIADETYYVIEIGDAMVACGGWSFRQTLFGNNAEATRDTTIIETDTGAARIRAFFVHPDFARRGLGSLLMSECERAASARGYRRLELMATLPGLRLYERHGFVAGSPVQYPLEQDLEITFVPMSREID